MGIEIISAGAGSGKTFSLTEKLFEILNTGKTTPDKILAMTYLKKAANELKERVSSKLIEKNRADLALQMQSARIGTVHSVCAEFLRQFSFELGESPDLNPIEEFDAELLFSEALNSCLSGESADQNMEIITAIDFKKGIANFQKSIRSAATLARKNLLNLSQLETSRTESLNISDKIFNGGVDLGPKIEAAIKNYVKNNKDSPSNSKVTVKAHEAVGRISGILQLRPLKVSEIIDCAIIAPGKKDEESFVEILALAEELIHGNELKKAARDYINIFFDTLIKVLETYQELKIQKGLIDYEDMETKMFHLLDIPEVQDRLKQEIDFLLVDEFQDTPPIQLAIFKKLSEICKEVIWVGDIKQSILGFAGSDPELMRSLLEDLKNSPTGQTRRLEGNWRSHEALVQFCNDVFGASFKLDGLVPEDVCLTPKKRYKSKPENHFEVWGATNGQAGERVSALAEGVSQLLKSDLKITDRRTGEVRGVQPGDIAVLMRGNLGCKQFSAALSKIGIDSTLPFGSVASNPEGALLLAAYSFAIDKKNTEGAAEFAILAAKDEAEAINVLKQIVLKVDEKNWSPLLAEIINLQPQVRLNSPSFIISEIIEKLNLVGLLSELSNPEQRISNIHSIEALAHFYEKSCFERMAAASPVGFIRFIDELSDAKFEKNPLEPLAWEKPSAVNILTMHKSKGLEWPVVLLGDVNEKGDKGFDLFNITMVQKDKFNPKSPLEGRLLHVLPQMFGEKNPPKVFDDVIDKVSQKMPGYGQSESEVRRLLYVAMTRAREVMIFGMGKSFEVSKSGQLDSLQDENENYIIKPSADQSSLTVGSNNYKAKFKTFTFDPDKSANSGAGNILAPVKVLPVVVAKSKVDADLGYYLTPSDATSSTSNAATKSAVKNILQVHEPLSVMAKALRDDYFGNFFHQVLAASVGGEADLVMIEKMAKAFECEGVVSAADVARSNQSLNKFITDRAGNKPTLATELPILVPHNKDADLQWIRGQVDLVVECKDKVLVIDHKTSVVNEGNVGAQTAKYFSQLGLYQEAMGYYYNKPVETWIYYPMSGFFVEVGWGIL
jgi:ATP-dependent exoDNAse (exonuclease V) beta subunit